MSRKALILHCWYGSPEDNWYPWLKKQLEENQYTVHLPDFPTMRTDLPDLEKQLGIIKDTLTVDKDTVVIGHSLGCLLGMRLAEKQKIGTLILVSGWDFNDLTEEHRRYWKTMIDHAAIKRNVKKIYCIASDNDPYFTPVTNEEMAKRLGGKHILIAGAGHFTKDFGVMELPKIVEILAGADPTHPKKP